jgi:hypothetical protein
MPTGRYQSRFFSFLSQQSLRLRDTTSQAWRQLKISAAWGAQIALYPIYATFQATRLVSRQIGQAVQHILPRLQAAQSPEPAESGSPNAPLQLTADVPIRQTLHAIETLLQALPDAALAGHLAASSLEETGAIEPSFSASLQAASKGSTELSTQPLRIQGIASLLTSRELVLVTLENQILNILTPDQQQHLQKRMVWELVTYHQQRRSLHSPPAINFLPLPADRPNAWLPIRVFYRLMSWMQTTPIAVATNLFQESQLALLHAADTRVLAQLPAAESLRSPDLPWLSLDKALSGLFHQPGSRQHHAPAHLPPATDSSPNSPQPAQPWLTWDSLFGRQPLPLQPSEWDDFNPAPESPIVKRRPTAINRNPQSRVHLRSNASTPTTDLTLAVPASTRTELVPSDTPQESGLAPTWIEAEVKLVTYVKHPLEQLLDWLDRGMVWIEQKLSNVLNWLRRSP